MAVKYFEYVCPHHPWIQSPRPLTACVGCDTTGKPCKGELKRIGQGSRGGKS